MDRVRFENARRQTGETQRLLDTFATAALIGLLAGEAAVLPFNDETHPGRQNCEDVTKEAYSMAAAMIRERSRRTPNGTVK